MIAGNQLVYIITNSDRAGAQQHLRSLLKHFSMHNQCELISGNEGYLSEVARKMGIRTTIIPELSRNVSPFNDYLAGLKIRRYLKSRNPDILHLHSAKAGFLGRLAAIGLGCKVVYTVHGWAFAEGNGPIKRFVSRTLEKLVANIADKIILVSNYDFGLAMKSNIAPEERLQVIHNGIGDLPAKPARISKSKLFHAISLVRFAGQKNLPCMVSAVELLGERVRLTIAGDGPLYAQISTLVERSSARPFIELAGEVRDVDALLVQADVFVLSSDWEGLPIAILEACRMGLPIVSTDVGGVNEIIVEGGNGFLVPPRRPDCLAAALLRLIDDPQLAERMGRRSREIFLERFTEDKMLDETGLVYAGVLG